MAATKRVNPMLVVHGGAGDIPESRIQEKINGLKCAAKLGYDVLEITGDVLDGIEAAICYMEDHEAFNAGKGSVLNLDGEVEMEALMTEGKHLNAGAVSLVRNVKNPIKLARMVMEETPHTILGGEGVDQWIDKMKVPRVPEYSLIIPRAIDALEKFKKKGGKPHLTEIGQNASDVGTVGCVAVDSSGHVGSGTSTGGMNGKYKGRIGDTPLPGCGGYSDDDIGAVSTTGHGESILKYNLAHRILTAMKLGKTAQEATKESCEGMTSRVGETAGAITVSNEGQVGISFTSKRMAWAYYKPGEIHFGIDSGDHYIDKI